MIRIVNADLREELETALGRKPTREELANFTEYVSGDVHEWLKDNAKSWVRDRANL